jgi:hypothetical protein
VIEIFIPAVYHLFDCHGDKIRAWYLHPPAHLSFYFIIMAEVFSLIMLLQWSKEVEVISCNMDDE